MQDRRHGSFTLPTVVLVGLSFAVAPMAAQHEQHGAAPARNGALLPAGTIDGEKTPDLIPDDVAFRLVLSALAEPADATPEMRSRQRAKLDSFGLADADLEVFRFVLADFQSRLHRMIATQRLAEAAGTRVEQRRSEIASLVTETLGTLSSRVSGNGMIRFRAFVLGQKRYMKIAPLPSMPQ